MATHYVIYLDDCLMTYQVKPFDGSAIIFDDYKKAIKFAQEALAPDPKIKIVGMQFPKTTKLVIPTGFG